MAFWNLGSWADLLFSPSTPKSAHPRAKSRQDRPGAFGRRLGFEMLESRQMMAVDFSSILNIEVPGSKTVFVPLTGSDNAGSGGITYVASSSNPNLAVSLQSTSSQSLKLHIKSTLGATTQFEGDLIFHLFEDVAPVTTARIKELVNSNYYDGLDFFRIIDGFIAQAGRKTSGATDQKLDDEYNPSVSFVSRGLLAMANAGDDTGTAEFFVTAVDFANSDTPATTNGNGSPGSGMPQHLNFQHTIFGQLVAGFEIFDQIMETDVTGGSDPDATITIVSADIVSDNQNAVLRVSPQNGFTGTATITVTATGTGGATAQRSFTATAITDESPLPPYFSTPINDMTTTAGQPVTFNTSIVNVANRTPVYDVVNPTTLQPVANVTVNINQATGQVTLTPVAGFTGTIDLMVRVRASDDPEVTPQGQTDLHDSETFKLTVNAAGGTGGSLSGVAYVDKNTNGVNDAGDIPLVGVLITLTGKDVNNNEVASRTVTTGADGSYSFTNVIAGTYTIREAQATKLQEGVVKAGTLLGTVETNAVSGIVMVSTDGTGYNFTEGKLAASKVSINMFLASTPTDQQSYAATIKSSTLASVVSITRASANPSSATTVAYTVRFNRAVTGVNAADFTLLTTGINGAGIASVTGSGATYTVTVNTGTGTGTIALKLSDDDSIVDSAGNPLAGAGSGTGNFVGEFYTINKVAAVAITSAPTINAANLQTYVVKGTGQPGRTVSIVLNDQDGNVLPAVTAPVQSDGTWTSPEINAQQLNDAPDINVPIQVKATQVDSTGATSTDTENITKDTEGDQPEFTDSSIPATINSTNVGSIVATGFAVDSNALIRIVVKIGGEQVKVYDGQALNVPTGTKFAWSIPLTGLDTVNNGTLEFEISATDGAGNKATISPNITRTKDTILSLEMTVSPQTLGNTINAQQKPNVSVSGTSDEPNRQVQLKISDEHSHVVNVTLTTDANGNWSTDQNFSISTLEDGLLTFEATITDAAGNTKTVTKTMVLDTAPPTGQFTTLPSEINFDNQNAIQVQGTTNSPAATITLRATSTGAAGSTTSVPVQANAQGNWTVNNFDLHGLTDGNVTIEATIVDQAGNTTMINSTVIVKDTVFVNLVTNPIDLSNVDNVTVSGTGKQGAEVTLTVTDQFNTQLPTTLTTIIDTNGDWSFSGLNAFSVRALSDGLLTFTATAELNDKTATHSKTNIEKRTVFIGNIVAVNDANKANYTVSGSGQIGATVKVKISDGSDFVESGEVTIQPNGTWSITGLDLHDLADGDLTVTATVSDNAAPTPHTATAEKTINKDTVPPTISTVTAVSPINLANQHAVTLTGTGEAAAKVVVTVTDSANAHVTSAQVTATGGNWTVSNLDLSSLKDGQLTFVARVTDTAGNFLDSASEVADKHTVVIDTITTPLNNANKAAVEVKGTGQVGAKVTVKAENGATSKTSDPVTVQPNGSWTTTMDLTTVSDGTVTFTATITDEATPTAHTDTSVTTQAKDTVVIKAITSIPTTINSGNIATFTVGGTGENDVTVELEVSDGNHSPIPVPSVVIASGTWTIPNFDVSGLDEGDLTFTFTFTDAFGNEVGEVKTVVKDAL